LSHKQKVKLFNKQFKVAKFYEVNKKKKGNFLKLFLNFFWNILSKKVRSDKIKVEKTKEEENKKWKRLEPLTL
jgi:hypothetical protein